MRMLTWYPVFAYMFALHAIQEQKLMPRLDWMQARVSDGLR